MKVAGLSDCVEIAFSPTWPVSPTDGYNKLEVHIYLFSGVPKCNNSLKVAAVAAGFQTHMSIIIANKLYVFDLFMTKQFVLQRGVRNNIDTTTFFFFPFPLSPIHTQHRNTRAGEKGVCLCRHRSMKVTSHKVLLRVCTLLLALAASVARASAEAPPAIDKAFVSGLLESAKADKDFREWMLSGEYVRTSMCFFLKSERMPGLL